MKTGEGSWVGVSDRCGDSVGIGDGEGDCVVGLHAERRNINRKPKVNPIFIGCSGLFTDLPARPIFIMIKFPGMQNPIQGAEFWKTGK